MGCFFSCFRIKDNSRRSTSSCANSIVSDEWVRDAFPLFRFDWIGRVLFDFVMMYQVSLVSEKGTAIDSSVHGREAHSLVENFGDGKATPRNIENEDSAARSKTNEEVQERTNEVFSHTFQDDGLSSGFPSEPRALGDMNNNLDEQSDAMQNVAKLDNNLGQHANNFDRFIFEGQQTTREVLQPEGNNYVSQVDCDQDSVDLDISPSQNDSKIQTVENDSPCPTPLNLIDEMQTPSTVYPVNSENRRTAQCNRIHTQYIYPVLKPVENLPHRVSLRQGPALLAQSDDCFEQQLKIGTTDSTERRNKVLVGADHEDSNFINSKLSFPYIHRNHDGNLISSTLKSVHKNTPCDLPPIFGSSDQVNIEPETPEIIISNVSKWLKPEPLDNEKGLIMHVPNNLGDDRPIIGTVAAHWADTVPFPKSPMFWGLNGIPNSTNKYKEDQKVSWHATLFEERLEKVLSDEKHLPQRKLLYREPADP
ncbi:protein JASON-like [Canna indica]|uniref:Protein JASON-like n=1 Tax=Canna indica TaxID=4628 RepID=A0AAQ3L5Y2_9LILI|nr:protein JASON-like [Canna indica]